MYPLWKKAGFDDDVMRKNQATAVEVNRTNIGTGSEAATLKHVSKRWGLVGCILMVFPERLDTILNLTVR